MTWDSSVGVFEASRSGTQATAHAVGPCKGFALACGRGIVAALEKLPVVDRMDYISTAGGAF